MEKYFRYVSVPDNSINKEEFDIHTSVEKEKCHCGSAYWPGSINHHSSVFTDELRQWLEQFNCEILKAESFKVYANTALAWHNDTNDNLNSSDLDPHETAKLNFTWGVTNKCTMEYGQLINPPDGLKTVVNIRGRRAYVYDPAKMKVDEEFTLSKPVLINRGPTHRLVNHSDQDCFCLSCILIDSTTKLHLTFIEAIERFNSVCVS